MEGEDLVPWVHRSIKRVDILISEGGLKHSRIPESSLSLDWVLEDCVLIKASGISGAEPSWGSPVPDTAADLRQVEGNTDESWEDWGSVTNVGVRERNGF